MRRSACALLLFLVVGCADSTLLTGLVGPALDFVVREQRPTLESFRGTAEPSARVETWPGRIVVQGWISTGTACYRVEGSLRARRNEIVLRVTPHRTGEGCGDAMATFQYQATIGGLEPGRYRLRVVHRDARGREQQVFDDNVRVRSR